MLQGPASDLIDRPVVFPIGRQALAWVRAGGAPQRGGAALELVTRWHSFWFEFNLSLQGRLPPPSPLKRDPIFILGFWRSGTTLMHNLLGAIPEMIYPTTWQCMNPSSFRLRSPPLNTRHLKRPMDQVVVHSNSPQEDEFALLALGAPSVYRGFFDPRRLDELTFFLELDAWTPGTPGDWLVTWREFLTAVADQRNGRLVLKSPNHTFRARALNHEFPFATYIWIVRNPIELFFSNRKMWVAMFKRYAWWHWQMDSLDLFLARALDHAATCLEYLASALPASRLAVVDFTKLAKEPVSTMAAIGTKLRLFDDEAANDSVMRKLAPNSDIQPDNYGTQDLPPELRRSVLRLSEVQRAVVTTHGI